MVKYFYLFLFFKGLLTPLENLLKNESQTEWYHTSCSWHISPFLKIITLSQNEVIYILDHALLWALSNFVRIWHIAKAGFICFSLGFLLSHRCTPKSFCLLQDGQCSLSTRMLLRVGGMFLSSECPFLNP